MEIHTYIVGANLAAQGAVAGAASGGFSAALNGGGLGDVLKGAVIGGIQGAVAGSWLHSMEGAADLGGLWYDKAAHIVGHGVLGGAANEAMGGKFQDGFLSAAAGAYAGWTILENSAIAGTVGSTVGGRTAIAAIVGGTASAVGGGKFANGAWTAAFQHLLNAELITKLEQAALKKRVGKILAYSHKSKIGYLNDANLRDLLAYHLLGIMDDPINGLDWFSYTKDKADSPFHYGGLDIKEFYFENKTSDQSLPPSGIYTGSEINYYAVGMVLGMTGIAELSVVAVGGWNYAQALNEWRKNGYTAKWLKDTKQIVTAQPWTRAGFSYYINNSNKQYEGYE